MLKYTIPATARHLRFYTERMQFNPQATFQFTQSPNPSWTYGDGAKPWLDPTISRKSFDFTDLSSRESYKILTSTIIPRPIALVSSLSADGVPNLAPFSYFSMVGHIPPLLSISCSLSQKRSKDTRENICATKEFTVSIVSEALAEAANCTAAEAPASVDEWILSGLTPAPSTLVKPACVMESAVSLECELYFLKDISPPNSELVTTTLILGLIKKAHIHESVLADDGSSVDPRKLRPIARMGGTPVFSRGSTLSASRGAQRERLTITYWEASHQNLLPS
ncbi:flavoprotein oxygenase [Mycena maculata]|uniref:Flavoprotein oxygenase n=1 Tax=Mycena maculata TaxID=230809 RepID=A0AAD7JR35_9AGAR|nr:flavoprotein oxygenase [Mycena maculata]